MSDDKLKTMTFNQEGYTLNIPVLDETHFVSWNSIDTIIFGPETIYHDHSEFIIYLNRPPIIRLKENAWWLNKLTFRLKNKHIRKIRISDEWNRDFANFIDHAKIYLKNVNEGNINVDQRKGNLIKRTEVKKADTIITTEQWKPEKTTNLKWQMVYDRDNRTVADIYNRDKGI